MMRIIGSILLYVMTLAAGCSTRQAYDTVQNTGRSQCMIEQTKEGVSRCEANFTKTYDEYQRERRALLRTTD